MNQNRWQTTAPSAYPWEQVAIDHLRAGLPDREPFRAWSNFEFVADDGTINEVDVLVLTATGLYLLEIKSRPCEISGDAHTWTWRDGARPPTAVPARRRAGNYCKTKPSRPQSNRVQLNPCGE